MRSRVFADGAFAAVAVLVALGIKAFYSHAGASALTFVLGPSCWLAAHLGGLDLVAEEGAGFISRAHRMVVGPACAGVNFLVVAFLAVYFSRPAGRRAGVRGRGGEVGELLIAAVAAYAATVVTNALRIVLAAHLFELGEIGGLTPEGLHRLAGVVIYCLSLVILCRAVAPARRSPIVPLACYAGVVIGIPVLDGAARSPLFIAHALVVTAACAVVALAYRLWDGASKKPVSAVDRV